LLADILSITPKLRVYSGSCDTAITRRPPILSFVLPGQGIT
jgi:hypothetical protein